MTETSSEQLEAINAGTGAWVIVAGPGVGKTRVIVGRYLRLISSGVPSSQILSLTFTNEAAVEMAKRSGIVDAKSAFRTFHSFCLYLLQAERECVPFEMCSTIIPVENQNYELLFQLCKTYPAISHWKDLADQIGLWQQMGVSPEQAKVGAIGSQYYTALAYAEYEEQSRKNGWLDFNQLQDEAVKLLENNVEVRDRYQFIFVQADEAQDLDASQFKLLRLLSQKHGNVFIVGDQNQNLYSWRGSLPDGLTNFHLRFPGATTLYLSTNFRSTQKLVSYFREILPVDNGLASRMTSAREEGVGPTFTRYADDRTEAEVILDRIDDPQNTAVITRTNRQLYLFEKLCASRNIKYRILGKKDFFELSEVKKLVQLAKQNQDDFQGVPASEALQSLISRHRLFQIYRPTKDPTEATPAENLNDLCKMAARRGSLPEFLAWLRKATYARRSSKGLTLSTVHQSKGKEWTTVYLTGVNQGLLPHKNGEIDEERRIYFVGCSRASDNLHISFWGARSMFLNEVIDQIKVYTPEVQ